MSGRQVEPLPSGGTAVPGLSFLVFYQRDPFGGRRRIDVVFFSFLFLMFRGSRAEFAGFLDDTEMISLVDAVENHLPF